jgi:hypothetical protein
MFGFLLFFLFVQTESESVECQAEWQKILASQNPSTSLDENYQKMYAYSGFQLNSLGNYDSCNKISIARYVVLTYNILYPLIVQTFCGPIVCTKDDYLTSTLPFIQGTPIEVHFPHKYQEDYYSSYSASAILMLIFMFILIGITVIATIADYFSTGDRSDSMLYKSLLAFSLIKNVKVLLMQRSQQKLGKTDTLDILNAARVMSTGWIVLFHSFMIQVFITANSNYDSIFDEYGDSNNIIPLTAPYAVDTFFWIGGLLMAFFYIAEVERAANYSILDVLKHYMHRYFRISPAIFFAILFFWSLEKYLGNGPLFYNAAEKSMLLDCDKYMYTNILYLNNIIPDNKGNLCMIHTWSMAIDTQYFVFFTLVLLVYIKVSKLLGWLLIAASCCCGIVTSGIMAAKYDLLVGLPIAHSLEYYWYYYTKPYTRLAPYALGVAAGIILYSFRQQQQGKVYDRFANSIANAFNNAYFRYGMFFLGLCLINTFMFAQLDVYKHPGPDYEFEEWNEAQSSSFIAFERFGFGLGVMLVLMPLLLGHFSWIIEFMAYGPWSVFARISFCVYVIILLSW